MLRPSRTSVWQLAAAVSVGVLAAGALWWRVSRDALPPRPTPALPESAAQDASLRDNPALRYARAVQEGNCDVIIPMTAWMRDRVKAVLLEDQEPGAQARVREELCDRMQWRTTEGNQLRLEGVEDQYVFAPGTRLGLLRADTGRSDLNAPVRKRFWIRVTFPAPSRALADTQGRPIRSLAAGVSISHDDTVLKANVVGNLEIDYGSFLYDWP